MSDPTETASTGLPEVERYEALVRDQQAAGQGSGVPEPDRHGDPEVELVKRAAEILGVEQMVRWMKLRIPSLNYHTPLSLMATPEGRAEVERALGRIEHGV